MAQVTITINDAQLDRVREAFAARAGVPVADLGLPEFRAALAEWIRGVVRDHEINLDLQAMTDRHRAERGAYVNPSDVPVS